MSINSSVGPGGSGLWSPDGHGTIGLRSILQILPQPGLRQSAAWRYGGAVLVTLGFIAARWLLGFVIDDGVPFATLFIPIALSAFYGGLGPGIVSVLITMALADYFLIPPLYTFGFPDTKAVVATLLFSVSGLIISALGEASRNAILQALSEAEVSKAAQQQLLANEERLRITERVVAGGVWDWDIPNDIVYWSDGYRRLYDYPLDETPSREKWLRSLLPEDRERIVALLDDIFRQKLHNWSLDHRARTASGRLRWVASHGQVFYDAAGNPNRMVGINFDITARKAAQDSNQVLEPARRLN
jgi:PAS domain S-box-containing protein